MHIYMALNHTSVRPIGGQFSLDGTIHHSPRCSTDNLATETLKPIAPVFQLGIINSSVIL